MYPNAPDNVVVQRRPKFNEDYKSDMRKTCVDKLISSLKIVKKRAVPVASMAENLMKEHNTTGTRN